MTQLIKYTKSFKITMSNKDTFTLNENEMEKFKAAVSTWSICSKDDWTLINPSFFMTAKPFKAIDWLNEEQQARLEERKKEYKAQLGKMPSESKIAEWIEKLKKWLTI